MSVATNGRPFDQYLIAAVQSPPKGVSSLRQEDAELIKEFIENRISNRGIKPHTAKVMGAYLTALSRMNDSSFKNTTDKGLQSCMSQIRTDFKKNTQRRMIPIVKLFFYWLLKEDYNSSIEKESIDDIKSPNREVQTKKPGHMLNVNDLTKLIQAAKNPRDKAIIALMFESACRPIEICQSVWDDIVFDKYGAQFTANSKTEKARYIRLIFSAPYLITWSEHYPGNAVGENPMFPSLKRRKLEPITQSGLKSMIYTAAIEAKLDKKVHPYLMRHSRITQMVTEEIPESVIKSQCWGSLDSRMLSSYTHLKNSDIDRILLTRAGIKVMEKKEGELKPPQCPKCGKINNIGAKWCDQCRTAMTTEAAVETDRLEVVAERYYATMSPQEREEVEDRIAEKVAAKLASRKKKSL